MASSVRSYDDTEISFVDSGGDGPAVMVLHGLTMTSRVSWESRLARDESGRLVPAEGGTFAATLRDAGARTILVDARGHGESGSSSDPARYRGDAPAKDAQTVIDALDLDMVDVVGYSMGAATAARLLRQESRLRSVVLCGFGPHLVGDGDEAGFFADFGAELGRVFQENAWDERPDLKVYRYGARLDPVHDFGSIGAAWIGIEPVPAERLESATVPVLVLNGGNDDGDGNAQRVAAAIPGARSATVGDGDHMMATYDDAFHDAVVSFLREHWSRVSAP